MKTVTYYDYTDKTVDEWHKSLENSEVNDYVFINHSLAMHKINNVFYIKEYKNNCVNTYECTSKEANELINEWGENPSRLVK